MNHIETLQDENQGSIPVNEPERQQYFMNKVRSQVEEMSKQAGRPLTCCINTFGCQMNFAPVTA